LLDRCVGQPQFPDVLCLRLGFGRRGPENCEWLRGAVACRSGQDAQFILISLSFVFLLEEIIFLADELGSWIFYRRQLRVQDLFDADFAFGD
jgi:hypothetical protein